MMEDKQKGLLATSLLDAFTKLWCVKKESPSLDFECIHCTFCQGNDCIVKKFALEKGEAAGYPLENFGSMAR